MRDPLMELLGHRVDDLVSRINRLEAKERDLKRYEARISALRDALEACLRHPTFMHRTVTEIMDAALRADDEASK